MRFHRSQSTAGVALGLGMGGFVDGILFHQVLQLHSMLSARLPRTTLLNEQVNMFYDGLFHAFCWAMTALGIFLLWRVCSRLGAPPAGRTLLGALALGWGLFNLVEGTVDHELLGLHHVYENGPHLPWNLAFLASGLLLAVSGLLLGRNRPGSARNL